MVGKYQAYSKYKDSGIEWLGLVPKHWEVKRISYVAILKSGDAIVSEKIEDKGSYPVYGGNGLRGYSEDFNYDGNYILIGRQGALCGNINYGYGKFWASEHAVVVHPSIPLNFKWLGETLRAMDLNQYNVSAAQPGLAVSNITSLKIPFPSVDEQTQIANFLDHETAKIDTLIEKQQQLIQLLKEKRQAVISHAVTKGLNPDVPMRDSGVEWLGEVPEHWELPKLIHVTTNIGDGLHSTPEYQDATGYFFINGNNLVDGAIVMGSSAKEVPEEEYRKHYIHLDTDSVLLSINGTIGNVARHNGEKIILGKSAAYINSSSDLLPDYLMRYLQSNQIKHYFDLEVTGTTIFNLSLNSLRQMRVCIPSKNEQIEIEEYCFNQTIKYNLLIERATSAIALMQERRTALISAAVTGKIDVRHWQAPESLPFIEEVAT